MFIVQVSLMTIVDSIDDHNMFIVRASKKWRNFGVLKSSLMYMFSTFKMSFDVDVKFLSGHPVALTVLQISSGTNTLTCSSLFVSLGQQE